MTWDSQAIAVTEKSIGVVEASMDYGAVANSGPIAVGLLQWTASRAKDILIRIRTENPTSWTGIPSSLDNDLTTHSSDGWSWWSKRYLNGGEIAALKPVLRDNIAIQDNQAQIDIDSYKDDAVNLGMDPDANTQAVQLFCNADNLSPSRAALVISQIGPNSNFDRVYAGINNDAVLGSSLYKTRWQKAKTVILANDSSGIGTGTVVPDDPNDGGDAGTSGGNNGGSQPLGNLGYLTMPTRNRIYQIRPDGTTITWWLTSGNIYTTYSTDPSHGVPLPPPSGGGGTPPSGAIADMIAYCASVSGTVPYSQGAGRLNYPASGYTDCSGFTHYLYQHFADMEIGATTGPQSQNGTTVSYGSQIAGDLIFFRWGSSSPSTFDHVAICADSTHQWSQGKPSVPGPEYQTISDQVDYALGNGGSILVKRYIT